MMLTTWQTRIVVENNAVVFALKVHYATFHVKNSRFSNPYMLIREGLIQPIRQLFKA